jgi:hypothetical protein
MDERPPVRMIEIKEDGYAARARMAIVSFCLALLVGLSATCIGHAQNFYSHDEVLDVTSFWKAQVANAMKESIKPSLTNEQLRKVDGIDWAFPTVNSSTSIGFGASGSRVILPIQSWMFIQDLVAAYIWQDVNDCQPTVLAYSNLLKYRDPSTLPGGMFPDPIEAMGIPSPNTAKLARLSPEFASRFERVFYGVLVFVTAHEVGHVVLGHSAPTGWTYALALRDGTTLHSFTASFTASSDPLESLPAHFRASSMILHC